MRATADQTGSALWHPPADSHLSPHVITWNGTPFTPCAAPVRQSRVVRLRAAIGHTTAPSHVDRSAKSAAILWEHDICLASPDITLIISNMPEAEDEIPSAIITDYRDLGTFRNAPHFTGGGVKITRSFPPARPRRTSR